MEASENLRKEDYPMSYTTKRKIMNSTVYLVLGLVVAAVVTITVVTFVSMRSHKQPENPTPPEHTFGSQTPSEKNNQSATSSAAKPTPSRASESPTPSEKSNTPVIDPTKQVSYLPTDGCLLKGYSMDLPVYSLTMNDYRTHSGIDISAPIGTAVVAMRDGVILEIRNDPMMGMSVSVDHGDGLVSIYKNLSATLPEGIAKGVSVKAGQTIAAVGDTSLIELAEAEHLHFELTLNGKHVNPEGYLDLNALSKKDQGTE